MTPEELAQRLLEDFDPEEVENLAASPKPVDWLIAKPNPSRPGAFSIYLYGTRYVSDAIRDEDGWKWEGLYPDRLPMPDRVRRGRYPSLDALIQAGIPYAKLLRPVKEDFDPEEVEQVASSIDTDVHHLHQLMEILQGTYPHVLRPRITYWQSEPGIMEVKIEFDWDLNSTSPWTIAALLYAKGQRLGIEFASQVAIVDEMRDLNPGYAQLHFAVLRKSKTPIKGSHRIEEAEEFEPGEVEKLAKSAFGRSNWRLIDSWTGGGAWWDAGNNEMLYWTDESEDFDAPGARVLVYRFPVKPLEEFGFVDIPRLLFDVDISEEDWAKADIRQKLAVIAASGYADQFDRKPVWYTRSELKRLLKHVPY